MLTKLEQRSHEVGADSRPYGHFDNDNDNDNDTDSEKAIDPCHSTR
jgi:hypothetical protein